MAHGTKFDIQLSTETPSGNHLERIRWLNMIDERIIFLFALAVIEFFCLVVINVHSFDKAWLREM